MGKSLILPRATILVARRNDFYNPQFLFMLTRTYSSKGSLKDVLKKKITEERQNFVELRKLHGQKGLGEIKLANVMGGMRGLNLLITETSYVDAKKGLFYRNKSLQDAVKELPRFKGGKEPIPEGCFWLLVSGNMPKQNEVDLLSCEWANRGKLPEYAIKLCKSMDKSIHPMAQLSAISACLTRESEFQKAFAAGVKKTEYWEYIYEDAMNLIAFLPSYAALIYTNIYKEGKNNLDIDMNVDWSTNYCRMLGFDDPNFIELIRLYMVLHADHEGGNVSAHATTLVSSALSDPFLSFAAGMCGLAGPLHGLANQEVVIWLQKLIKAIGEAPEDKAIIDYVDNTLKQGQVVPGYGHAVLRQTDPRFTLQAEFAKKYCPDDKNVKLVGRLYKIVPEILKKLGKVANPYPNVDAHSGVLLRHYCLNEMSYYTVLFGVSRALGVMAQLIWARALGAPIERPKSFTIAKLCEILNNDKKKK